MLLSLVLLTCAWSDGAARSDLVHRAAGPAATATALKDGFWYGKIVSVDVPHRKLTLAPACTLSSIANWVNAPAARRVPSTVAVPRSARLTIYYRPGGSAAKGHPMVASLKLLADVALHRHPPDYPAGWFVTVQYHQAIAVSEQSGERSTGKAELVSNACLWSHSTELFVSS